MDVDLFKEVLVPVIGGLGIFMLGLEFMANGIQALSVNKMREWLAKMAGTPVKGLAEVFRKVWSLGRAGVLVPLVINRDGKTMEVNVRSGDRRRFLKGPVLH